jgi:hypothetical protein
VPRNEDVGRSDENLAAAALETWDGEGGRGAQLPEETAAVESPVRHVPPPSRRVGGDRRRGDRRRCK